MLVRFRRVKLFFYQLCLQFSEMQSEFENQVVGREREGEMQGEEDTCERSPFANLARLDRAGSELVKHGKEKFILISAREAGKDILFVHFTRDQLKAGKFQ